MRLFAALAMIMALTGCAATAERVELSESRNTTEPSEVRVFFGTDRGHLVKQDGSFVGFANQRSYEKNPVTLGWVDVEVPQEDIDSLSFVKRFANKLVGPDDVGLDYYRLGKPNPLSPTQYCSAISEAADGLKLEEKIAILFVHGYNNNFDRAARTAAAFHVGLGLNAVPFIYSWSSHHQELDYVIDAGTIDWSEAYFTEYLKDLVANKDFTSIILIGHSMGSRLLLRGLADLLASDKNAAIRVKALVLAGADIDAGAFRARYVPLLEQHNLSERTAVYVDERDGPLRLSGKVNHYPRLGLKVVDEIEPFGKVQMLDSTKLRMRFPYHSGAVSRNVVVKDMQHFIGGKTASQRSLLKSGSYFRIVDR